MCIRDRVKSESFPEGNRSLLGKLIPLLEDEISDEEIVAMFTRNCRAALGLPDRSDQ